MKKVIMIFAVLASVSFAANDEYRVLGMVGDQLKVEKIATHEITLMKSSEAVTLGITDSGDSSSKVAETFVDALIPDKNKPVVGEEHPSVIPPMDVIDGTVTAAYGRK
ncbi:MAG: hypothetical protein Q7K47_05575 [Fusobacterium sp. JB019]|nr:hypothetical protein [Fusobacterium sp. JB019]